MKTIWVVVLSLIALLLGSCGGLAWRGASSAFEGLRIACAVVSTAESSGVMTKAQISTVIDRALAVVAKDGGSRGNAEQFAKELKAGCPTFGGGAAKK